jgi:[ribosomal protein S5]-alanine N-acetyltransferase
VLKGSERLIGAVGFVPSLGPFGQLHYFSLSKGRPIEHYNTPAFGLYWVIEKPYRGHGYATEAAHAMIRYAFDHLNMAYIVATTAYDNEGSQAVMRKLGMKIERNPFPEPEWFQVVGILENDRF